MTIGIPGGHLFICHPSLSSRACRGISFIKRKITRRILFKVYMILKFVADKV